MNIDTWKYKMTAVRDNFPSENSVEMLRDLLEQAEILMEKKVKIRSDMKDGEMYGLLPWHSAMQSEIGGKCVEVIRKTHAPNGDFDGYEVKSKYPGISWYITPEMVEKED